MWRDASAYPTGVRSYPWLLILDDRACSTQKVGAWFLTFFALWIVMHACDVQNLTFIVRLKRMIRCATLLAPKVLTLPIAVTSGLFVRLPAMSFTTALLQVASCGWIIWLPYDPLPWDVVWCIHLNDRSLILSQLSTASTIPSTSVSKLELHSRHQW